MIAVIADDFTGAAELGGMGLAHGLAVEIATVVNPASKADLLVIATDTRSVSEPEAVRKMGEISTAIRKMNPHRIYKKIDSVLRGHVIPETRAQLQALELPKALLVPANPALGRTLVNGQYYVNGELIHRTHFAHDPEFPVTVSDVAKRFENSSVVVQSCQDALPVSGLVIGNAGSPADLQNWARRIDPQTLVGGGSGFFSAVLDSLSVRRTKSASVPDWGILRLFVCGSAFQTSVELIRKAVKAGHPVHFMPTELMRPGNLTNGELAIWANELVGTLRRQQRAILAIGADAAENPDAVHLRTVVAQAVGAVVNRIQVDELVIEGGSTASAILRQIGVTRLVPTQELATGVVRSRAVEKESLQITVKPGSYHWPPAVWTF